MSTNQGFILREDAALKAHLQGVRLRDASSPADGRQVPVYFRLPEQEARARTYPYITIDLLSISRDPEREHRGTFSLAPTDTYTPAGRVAGASASTDWPIPMTLVYQVTTFARFIQHDRQLTLAMVTGRLPERFGSVAMVSGDTFPDDNSIRRLDLLSGPTNADAPDPADPNKRIFRKAYTVAVSSEMFLSEITNLTDALLAREVILNLHEMNHPSVTS